MQGLAVGLLVSLLFSLVPLLEVRRVKPLLLLRGGDPTIVTAVPFAIAQWRDRARAIDWLQVSAAVVGQRGPGRYRVLAGCVSAHRADRLRRVCRSGPPPPRDGGADGARRSAVVADAHIRAAPCRPGAEASREPDTCRPARGRPRDILCPRSAGAAEQLARRVLGRARQGRAGHVPDRHPAGSGRAGPRFPD